MASRQLASMRLKNVQTNNIFTLTDREQIGKCLKQTFNSQVACVRYVDGKKIDDYTTRALPRFEVCTKKVNGEEVFDCHPSLLDLIPREEATKSIRERITGKKSAEEAEETLTDLKKFCYEKGVRNFSIIDDDD